jgi:hypothetical protein
MERTGEKSAPSWKKIELTRQKEISLAMVEAFHY